MTLHATVGASTTTHETGPVTIGRGSDSSVVVTGDRVSRVHVEVALEGDAWVATDRSSNGTFTGTGDRLDAPLVIGAEPVSLRLGAADGPLVELSAIAAAPPPEPEPEPQDAAPAEPQDAAPAAPPPDPTPPAPPATVGPPATDGLAAPSRARVTVLAVLTTSLVMMFGHLVTVAVKYEGGGFAGIGEAFPVQGNRIVGYLWVLTVSILLGSGFARLFATGPAATLAHLRGRAARQVTLVRSLDRRGDRLIGAAVALAAFAWISVRDAQFLAELTGTYFGYGETLSPGWALLALALTLVLADETSPVGRVVADTLGSLSSALWGDSELGHRGHGHVLILAIGGGFGIQALLRPAASWLVVLIGIAVAVGPRAAGRAAALVAIGLAVALPVTPALADDGGWTECGGTVSGYIGCPGSEDVLRDTGHAVPPAAVGSTAGAALYFRRGGSQSEEGASDG